MGDIEYTVATGYGRVIVPFAQKKVTEIACHGRGANWIFPTARTILDMGGQDCKSIRVDERGKVVNFFMNDKCAAGAGRSMEIMGKLLDVALEDIGELSLSDNATPAKINDTCVLFTKSDAITLLREGVPKSNILSGCCDGLVNRVFALLKRVGIEEDFVISGGIGKNSGVTKRLEERMGITAKIPEEPQIVGALGAALFARDRLIKSKKRNSEG